MIWLPCPTCLMSFGVPEHDTGKDVKCPVCLSTVRVPGVATVPPGAAAMPDGVAHSDRLEIEAPVVNAPPGIPLARPSSDILVAKPAPEQPITQPIVDVPVARIIPDVPVAIPVADRTDDEEKPRTRRRKERRDEDEDELLDRDDRRSRRDDERPKRKKSRSKKKADAPVTYEFDGGVDPNPMSGIFTRSRVIGIILVVWGLAVVVYCFSATNDGGAFAAGQQVAGFLGILILLAGVFQMFRGE